MPVQSPSLGSMKLQIQTARTSVIDKVRVKVRTILKTSTYSVRTLSKKGQIYQLIKGCKEINLDIIAIQEHRWRNDNDIDILRNCDFHFFYVFASKEGHRVVGIIIMCYNFMKSKFQIITMTLRCNPQITIMSAYAPTESTQLESKDSFYHELHTAVSSISAHNFVIVLWDFNARIGKISHDSSPQIIGRYSYHQNTVDNGERLVNLC